MQTDRRVAVVLHFAGTPTGEGDAGVVSRTCRMKTGAERYVPNGLIRQLGLRNVQSIQASWRPTQKGLLSASVTHVLYFE